MRMKKVFAAISAAAVAMSAMATSVGAAFEEHTINYNLVDYRWVVTDTTEATAGSFSIEFSSGDKEVSDIITDGLQFNAGGGTFAADLEASIIGRGPSEAWRWNSNVTLTLRGREIGVAGREITVTIHADGSSSTPGFNNAFGSAMRGGWGAPPARTGGELIFDISGPAISGELGAFDPESQLRATLSFIIDSALDRSTVSDLVTGGSVNFLSDGDGTNRLVRYSPTTAQVDVYGELAYPMGTNVRGLTWLYDEAGRDYNIADWHNWQTNLTGPWSQEYGCILYYLSTRAVNGTWGEMCEECGMNEDGNRVHQWNAHPNNWSWRPYYNVLAVINDGLTNYDAVTFKFNTATSPVAYMGGAEIARNEAPINADRVVRNPRSGSYINGAFYVDNGITTYMSLAPQLYNRYFWDSHSEQISTPWTGYQSYDFFTLFQGALVINERYTMSLQDVNSFDFDSESLSFTIDKIMDTNSGADVSPFATYIQSMRLATSNLWYWDSLDITFAAGAGDDVADIADIPGEDEIIPDDDFDDGDWDDWDDGDDWEDDPWVEDEIPEVIDVPVVVNPPTGNASVALAVIPVALAAAAIIIKKRNG